MKLVYSRDWMPFYNNSRRNSIALLYFGGALYKVSTRLLTLLLALSTSFNIFVYTVLSVDAEKVVYDVLKALLSRHQSHMSRIFHFFLLSLKLRCD